MKRSCCAAMFAVVASFIGTVTAQEKLIPVKVELITRAVAKTPVLIAYDRGIYKKYGLDVTLWMPKGEFPGAIETSATRMQNPEFSVDGGVPMVTAILANRGPRRIAIATNDCVARFAIVGQKNMKSIQDLKGKRLGISVDGAMTGFIYRVLAKRMGWTPGKDFTVVERAQRFEDLKAGKSDAFVADDRYMALAKAEGYPVLANPSEWNQAIAGSSVRVDWQWIKNPKNRDIALRFLKGTLEGVAIYMNDKEEALRVLAKYHGIKDRQVASSIYEEGKKMSPRMEPCVRGFQDMFTVGSYGPELQKYKPSDFYDVSLMQELEKSGFVDAAYKTARAAK
jgi:ABC-type nitrate/sulfonate/bicarbonate transport system substrate-binding protein